MNQDIIGIHALLGPLFVPHNTTSCTNTCTIIKLNNTHFMCTVHVRAHSCVDDNCPARNNEEGDHFCIFSGKKVGGRATSNKTFPSTEVRSPDSPYSVHSETLAGLYGTRHSPTAESERISKDKREHKLKPSGRAVSTQDTVYGAGRRESSTNPKDYESIISSVVVDLLRPSDPVGHRALSFIASDQLRVDVLLCKYQIRRCKRIHGIRWAQRFEPNVPYAMALRSHGSLIAFVVQWMVQRLFGAELTAVIRAASALCMNVWRILMVGKHIAFSNDNARCMSLALLQALATTGIEHEGKCVVEAYPIIAHFLTPTPAIDVLGGVLHKKHSDPLHHGRAVLSYAIGSVFNKGEAEVGTLTRTIGKYAENLQSAIQDHWDKPCSL